MYRNFWIVLLSAGCIAVVSTLPMFDIWYADPFIVLALPGMILSMAIAQNVHAFSPVLSLLFTWLFYVAMIFLGLKLVRRFRAHQ